MAKKSQGSGKKRPSGKPFKKGPDSRRNLNETPSPSQPPIIKRISRISASEIADSFSSLLFATDEDIEQIINSNGNRMIDKVIASVMKEALKTGDITRLDKILERIIGRVSQDLNINQSDSGLNKYLSMSPDERKQEVEKLRSIYQQLKEKDEKIKQLIVESRKPDAGS